MEGTDSMKQAGRVIEALEQRINGARRMPMTSLSMVDAGALIDLIGYGPSALACLCVTALGMLLLGSVREQPPKSAQLTA